MRNFFPGIAIITSGEQQIERQGKIKCKYLISIRLTTGLTVVPGNAQ